MTEIEFLATLLLDAYVSDDIRKKVVARIIEVEQTRALPPAPGIIYQYIYQQPYQYPQYIISNTCQHTYPGAWGGTGSPSCTKCGQPMSTGGGAGGVQTNLTGYIGGSAGGGGGSAGNLSCLLGSGSGGGSGGAGGSRC
jgi:hypothetical protein